MKKYTEEQLIKAIEYACQYQKGSDYQIIGAMLLKDDNEIPSDSAIQILDELASETNVAHEIEIKDIDELFI